jgi:hypothetical protein
MKTSEEVEVYIHTFLACALDRGEWSSSPLAALVPRKEKIDSAELNLLLNSENE